VTSIRALLTASEKAASAQSVPVPASPPGAPAVVLGGSEDTRLLLRGLLRLHRHRVLLEAPTREGVERLPRSAETKILVMDAGTEKGENWAEELTQLLSGRTDLRALVILPSSDPALEARARRAGARSTLVRPFAIRDFIQAVDALDTAPPPG